jgi:hypothetical protein
MKEYHSAVQGMSGAFDDKLTLPIVAGATAGNTLG